MDFERIRINQLTEDTNPSPSDNVAIDNATTRRTTASQLVNAVVPAATQEEAETGVDNTKRMTALRTHQAMATLDATDILTTPASSFGVEPVEDVLEDHEGRINDLEADVDGKVDETRQVATQHSLEGGGDLSEDRTLSLVNDEASPGNNKVYGTDGAGAKGWKDDPAGGANTVTAASTFATDNRLLRSDGTGRGAQASGVTLDDNARMTGHGNMAWQAATESGGDVTFDTANGSLLNWHVTLTDTAEVQIPANLPDGWTCYIEIDPDGQTITWAAAYRSPVPDFTEKALIAIVRRGAEYIATLAHEEAAA